MSRTFWKGEDNTGAMENCLCKRFQIETGEEIFRNLEYFLHVEWASNERASQEKSFKCYPESVFIRRLFTSVYEKIALENISFTPA